MFSVKNVSYSVDRFSLLPTGVCVCVYLSVHSQSSWFVNVYFVVCVCVVERMKLFSGYSELFIQFVYYFLTYTFVTLANTVFLTTYKCVDVCSWKLYNVPFIVCHQSVSIYATVW